MPGAVRRKWIGGVMNKTKDKRRQGDRRDREDGPPLGWKDRRRSVERRKPEVVETSLAEWEAALLNRAAAATGEG